MKSCTPKKLIILINNLKVLTGDIPISSTKSTPIEESTSNSNDNTI